VPTPIVLTLPAKDRAAKAHRRTNINVGRMGEPPALDDVDEALLRRLLGVEGIA
jgi:hypothetical protein